MNPFTGEVLALVSTPSYDTNAFIMGMTQKQWKALNEDEQKPLYNRFRQAWCPGSTFKPIIAAVGLQSGHSQGQTILEMKGIVGKRIRHGEHIMLLHFIHIVRSS